MSNNTATITLTNLVLLAAAAVGYVAGVINGAVAGMLVLAAILLGVVWFVGVLVEGASQSGVGAGAKRRRAPTSPSRPLESMEARAGSPGRMWS